jgi:hypothetical protein
MESHYLWGTHMRGCGSLRVWWEGETEEGEENSQDSLNRIAYLTTFVAVTLMTAMHRCHPHAPIYFLQSGITSGSSTDNPEFSRYAMFPVRTRPSTYLSPHTTTTCANLGHPPRRRMKLLGQYTTASPHCASFLL